MLGRDAIDSYRERGYLPIPGAFSAPEVEELSRAAGALRPT